MNASPPIRTFIPTEADRIEEVGDAFGPGCDRFAAEPVPVSGKTRIPIAGEIA